jgi:adenine-specific DNA-methyltransferase
MPPRKTKSAKPTPVEAITHEDKRANLPTADAQDFVSPEVEKPVQLRYPRDPTLDPQLVWKGKDELDGEDLVADAPPIYIQEKIDPRVLVENLRDTAAQPEGEPELTLFDEFDGLSELDLIEFYRHEASWSNRMILGDSLNVMASLAEREALRRQVQTIYMDPPYGIRFDSNWQASVRNRSVKDGKIEDATREVEQIKAFRDTWELGIHSYLSYLRDRMNVAKDLLAPSGSIFVQIGDERVHLVRQLLDEVFGSDCFCSQISFRTKIPLRTTLLPNIYDHILWYARSSEGGTPQPKFRRVFTNREVGGGTQFTWVELADGTRRRMTDDERAAPAKLPLGARPFRLTDLVSSGRTESCVFEFDFDGVTYPPPRSGKSWKTNAAGIARLIQQRRIHVAGSSPSYIFYADDYPVQELPNVWTDTQGPTGKQYVVQTATKIVERCILMTTDPGDLVLDPTCGSGTTAYVAEQWGRRWVTIDTSRVSLAIARQRLMGARFPYYLLADSMQGRQRERQISGVDLPDEPVSDDVRHGFVYERALHVTLGSIANNPDLMIGMSREDSERAIRRHAEFELLYDRPYEDNKKVRVAGPFTLESLSPYRSLGFAGSAVDATGAVSAGEVVGPSHGEVTFEQTILANLRAAGIQNGRKGERLTFASVEAYAANYMHAVGVRDGGSDGTPRKVGITIGPQYGTVDPSFIKDVAREAIKSGDIDLLCVLAFAFDPMILGASDDYVTSDDSFANVAAERRLGRIPVLLVRMNADLVMGEELKKTGAGNLFTVFGEPDIEIQHDGDELRVVLNGVDVYDPSTGEIRSNDTDQIALWIIDTAYNGESFFVRHCYFTGGQDPYSRLKRALKADIDEEAWATLYSTESRPFARPESGKIAVKVINDYGDEVMKVFDV